MNNAELINALRNCSCIKNEDHCKICGYRHSTECGRRIADDAADALEADEKRIDGLQKLVDINTERCEALRKQLREAHENYEKHLNELTTKCNQLQAAVDNYEKRIAELEAQLPKWGEWISDYDGFDYDVRCSVCGEEALIKEGGSHDHAYSHYCPNCGAKMDGKENADAEK